MDIYLIRGAYLNSNQAPHENILAVLQHPCDDKRWNSFIRAAIQGSRQERGVGYADGYAGKDPGNCFQNDLLVESLIL